MVNLADEAADRLNKLEEGIQKRVARTLERLGAPSEASLRTLKKRIKELEESIQQLIRLREQEKANEKPNEAEESNRAPETGESRVQPSESAEKIDINQADADELSRIPGIGEARAQHLIEYRNQQGPFADWEAVSQVPGISTELLEQIKANATLGKAASESTEDKQSG